MEWRLEAEETDPGLVRKYSSFNSYTTLQTTYPSIRTFYRPHPQAEKLPSTPTPLPLLVFVHGLGGCVAQFSPILTSLINVASCLAIDLPGCGRSKFSPKKWRDYTQEALAELVAAAVKQHCRTTEGQGVVFIAHSMGCSLSALVATTHFAPGNDAAVDVLGLLGICPQAEPFHGRKLAMITLFLQVPTCLFNLVRAADRQKGTDSGSIIQFTGEGADLELRQAQMRFNRQSRTPVFRRMAWGLLARHLGPIILNKGLAGLDTWARLKVPLFLVAGEADVVTKPDQLVKIGRALGKVPKSSRATSDGSSAPNPRGTSPHETTPPNGNHSQTETTLLDSASEPVESELNPYSRRRQVLKTSILPAPAAHALLYAPSTYRTLAGLIQTFLSEHVDSRLSLGWQLQHLSTEGKWDVKNLTKWQAIKPVSDPIAGIFRALKTLREIDDTHSPEKFVEQWRSKIKAVIDISHESPVYDPKGLEERGIDYHKFPTVSKIPPTTTEVQEFIQLVDRLRDDPSRTTTPQSQDPTQETAPPGPDPTPNDSPLIGVHCHYGFNRTGFFICSYLVEREGYPVQAAIDAFASARPKGIKHAHFLDQLFVRYCVGLKRAPTL